MKPLQLDDLTNRALSLTQSALRRIYALIVRKKFESSSHYWQSRYINGGTSGSGSYGRLAKFKATLLNELVISKSVRTVIEFGCGDGSQLTLANYPEYLGVDVSEAAVAMCRTRFSADASKAFVSLQDFKSDRPMADLSLSLDVIYHLVEDETFADHMKDLFAASNRLVAIYSSNSDLILDAAPHVRHRNFTEWIAREACDWHLIAAHKNPYPLDWHDRKNTSHSDLFIFEKRRANAP
jgi:cyclopropane fatty-acyl-phospholipid synthase-like methyltransferase